MVKSVLLHERGDFRSDPALPDGFVHDNDPARFFRRIYNRFDVERGKTAQIDHFRGNTLLGEFIRCAERRANHACERNDRDLVTLP